VALEFDFNTLVDFLSSPSWEQRRDAAEDLGAYRAQEAIPYLIRGLSDPVGAVQYASAVALGQIGGQVVVPYLLACLDNPNFGFHAPVLEALGNLRVRDAIPYFIKSLRHLDPHVRGISNSSLMVTTTQAFGFRATADEARREKAIQKWEKWWQENSATFVVPGGG
jgi:HEAT repeat protein